MDGRSGGGRDLQDVRGWISGLERCLVHGILRGIHHPARTFGLRQDDASEGVCGISRTEQRTGPDWRQGRHGRPAGTTRYGDVFPILCAVPPLNRRRRTLDSDPVNNVFPAANATSAWPMCCARSIWKRKRRNCPPRCPADNSNVWPWPGRWRCGPVSCCSMSPYRIWMPSCGIRCGSRSAHYKRNMASPQSTSPTTKPKHWPCQTACWSCGTAASSKRGRPRRFITSRGHPSSPTSSVAPTS